MNESAPEALKAALRRWLPLAAVLVVVGAIAVNAQRQLAGPEYSASARVFLTTTDLGALLTDTQAQYVDPRRATENAVALAGSLELYERAARRSELASADASALRDEIEVASDPESDVLTFTATTGDEDEAVTAANAVADEYVDYRSDIAAATVREAIAQLEERIAASPENAASLQGDLDRLRLLETLNSRDARVIEEAATAARISPRPARDTLLGIAIGLVVSLLIAGAREAFSTRVRTEADVEAALDRPVLASIPTLPRSGGLVTVGRHEGRFGDAYALLAASLMHVRGSDAPTVIAVTSAVAGEGKTTTASNLAVALARRGASVILADFDVRKPAVARMFRIPADAPGVVELVGDGVGADTALWTAEIATNGSTSATDFVSVAPRTEALARAADPDVLELGVLPAGVAEHGTRLGRSDRLGAVVAELRQRADVVVLDTPPALLTVEMTDLSRSVDLVVVVARQGKVTRRALASLRRQIERWQTEIAGAVLTGVPSGQAYGATYYSR
jgi:Mrp family chromosome partitioning ATPase